MKKTLMAMAAPSPRQQDAAGANDARARNVQWQQNMRCRRTGHDDEGCPDEDGDHSRQTTNSLRGKNHAPMIRPDSAVNGTGKSQVH